MSESTHPRKTPASEAAEAAAPATPPTLDQAWLLSNLGYLCTRVAAQARRGFSARAGGLDLNAVEFSIASVLATNAEVNQKQLCLALDLSASSLTLTLDRLVERRLVRRERGTKDRRETFVHLTASGAQLHAQASRAAAAADSEVGAGLTDIERLLLVSLLRKVIAPEIR